MHYRNREVTENNLERNRSFRKIAKLRVDIEL